jgi:hypothetical protein
MELPPKNRYEPERTNSGSKPASRKAGKTRSGFLLRKTD